MILTENLYHSYLDLRWHFDPAAGTAAGITSVDTRLGQFDVESMRAHIAAFRAMAGAIEEVEVDDTPEEIDRTAVLDDIRVAIFRFEREKPHIRNPGFWLSHLFQALFGLLSRRGDHGPLAPAALARLAATPAFLQSARATIDQPPRIFLDTAIGMAEGGRGLIRDTARVFGDAAPDQAEAIQAAADAAEAALAIFLAQLKHEIIPNADELAFAVGEEQFNRRLHHEHALLSTAPELYRYGLHLIDEVEAEIVALARGIDPNAPWRTVVEHLRQAAPAPADLVGAFRREMDRARGFVEERELVTIPEGALEVVETPDFLRPILPFAAYQPPEVYSADRTGYFYVTSPKSGKPAADSCSWELAATALHEGYPGHHLQMLTAQALPVEIRRVLWTPVTVEGWALYCEELLAEQGFFRSVEERLFQRIHLLWRAVRIVLDVGLHTRGMSPAEATDMLVEKVAMNREKAAAEVSRYCAYPTYQLSYAVGRRELLHLRQAYQAREGGAFDLRRFHDEVLSYGGLPVSLIRWGMDLGIDE